MIAIISASAVYLAGYMLTARWVFARTRPSKVPLCGWASHEHNGHHRSCYTRWAEIREDSEALATAVSSSLLWPVLALGVVLVAGIRFKTPETSAEKDERLRKLEKRNRELEAKLGIGGDA